MKQVILYSRVSTLGQAENGLSIENQISRLKQYAIVKDYKNLVVLTDNGVSGKNLKRQAFQQILESVKRNEVQAVLVYSLSRFGRNTVDILKTLELFSKYSVAFHSLTENLDTCSATGKFFLTVLSGLAQMEREQISERTKSVLQFKKSKNERVGQIAFGYSLGKNNKLRKNKAEQNTLRIIRALRKKGYTFNDIADTLIQLKRKNKSGTVNWNKSMVFKLHQKSA